MPDKLYFRIDPDDLVTELQEVMDYWNAKHGAKAMPRRADIDPLELRRHLPYLSIFEVLPGAADFRFRLLGTEITGRFGRDSTGRTMREVYGQTYPEVLQWMLDFCTSVVTQKRPVLSHGTLRPVGKDFIVFETLHLPLSEDGERVSMLFGRTRFITPENKEPL